MRQAGVFKAFAAAAGFADSSGTTDRKITKQVKKSAPREAPAKAEKLPATVKFEAQNGSDTNKARDMALTVRIEINLPAEGTRETYDAIFQSIRANLIDE